MRKCALWKLYALRGISSAHAGIKEGWPGQTICQYGGRILKREENWGDILAITCVPKTHIRTMLYCKIHSLRLDFACAAAVAVDQSGDFGNWQKAPSAIPTTFLFSLVSCDGRMPE